MIRVLLMGKMNAEFIVKDKNKIEMWKMLEERGMGTLVRIKTYKIR